MSPEATDFLYPFIEGDETDASSLLVDLARSAREKWGESTALRAATLEREHGQVEEVAAAMAQRFLAGGRLFTFGNGGSSTDAADVAALFLQPPRGRALPALALSNPVRTATGLARARAGSARPRGG